MRTKSVNTFYEDYAATSRYSRKKPEDESIDAAYAELLNPELYTQTWQSFPDRIPYKAIQAMIEVNSSARVT